MSEHETKWTPGPWKTEFMACHNGDVACCHGDGPGWWVVWTREWGKGIDQKANAHLIAAAPELYDSHESLLDALRPLAVGKPVRDLDERISRAEKVRAKARGESSYEEARGIEDE